MVAAPVVKRYTLASVTFKSQNDVPKDLLYRVLECFHMRLTVCKACFYKFRPQTETQLKVIQPVQIRDQLVCGSCNQLFSGLLVMPSCLQCDNNYGKYVPIAPKGQSSPAQSVEELVLRLVDVKYVLPESKFYCIIIYFFQVRFLLVPSTLSDLTVNKLLYTVLWCGSSVTL